MRTSGRVGATWVLTGNGKVSNTERYGEGKQDKGRMVHIASC
jgi:hypothetical protein